jgi:flavin reductase (DIM6/NTAB) family NADH-FMN oxidoreductase RutF
MSDLFPDWQPGQKIELPFSHMHSFDPAVLSMAEMYKLMIGAVVPRPIAFISTENNKGQRNLAPFSFFNGVSSDPPTISVVFSQKSGGGKKDSLINIEETGEFVVNTVSTWIARAMVHTAADFPYGVDEMEKVGLTPLASEKVRPPRVKESPIHMECTLYNTFTIGENPITMVTMVIGRIEKLHVAENALIEGKISTAALSPVARLTGFTYGAVSDITRIPTPQIKGDKASVKPE